MLDWRATLVHRASWRSTRARISAGVVPRTSAPKLSRRPCTSGTAMVRWISACRRSTIALAVLAGAAMPDQEITSNSGRPDSAIVGISGKSFQRVLPVMAIPLTSPLRRCGTASVEVATTKLTSPLSRPVMAGGLPRYGTGRGGTPAREEKRPGVLGGVEAGPGGADREAAGVAARA